MSQGLQDVEMEVVIVLGVADHAAEVLLPDTSVEVWQLVSLPPGVQTGDRVGVIVIKGNLACTLLPRLDGLLA